MRESKATEEVARFQWHSLWVTWILCPKPSHRGRSIIVDDESGLGSIRSANVARSHSSLELHGR